MAKKSSTEDYESPIIAAGEVVFNIMMLNVLWFICSLPIVTIGASTAALDYTCIKMRNDEGSSIVRLYFTSFAANIRQGAILGTGMLAVLIILSAFLIQSVGNANAGHSIYVAVSVIVMLLLLVWLLLFVYIFMVLSRFDNTLLRTVTNAVYLILKEPFRAAKVLFSTVVMLIVLPLFLFVYFPYGFPMVIFFGVPTTAYILAKEFNELFAQFIPVQE